MIALISAIQRYLVMHYIFFKVYGNSVSIPGYKNAISKTKNYLWFESFYLISDAFKSRWITTIPVHTLVGLLPDA